MKEEKEYQENYNTPKDADKFSGEFIIFFPEENKPEILFHTIIAEEAYSKAKEIEESDGRKPVVVRVSSTVNNIGQIISMRA